MGVNAVQALEDLLDRCLKLRWERYARVSWEEVRVG